MKHGRYSKALPPHLLARYQAAVADPDLLALREDIALLDTRLAQVVGRLDERQDAQQERATWAEIRGLLQERESLVASERKRLVDLHQLVRVEDAMLLMRQVVESVKRYVSDPRALRGISADVERLLTFDPGHVSDPPAPA